VISIQQSVITQCAGTKDTSEWCKTTSQKTIRGKMMKRKNPAFEALIPQQATMEYSQESFGEVKVFHLHGKIMGDATTQMLCSCLKDLIAAGTRSLVMDFQHVRWINSSGVGAIVACLNTLRQHGGDIRFANLQGTARQYFHISKLETVVKIFDSVDEAVASFASGKLAA
jgi:anti-sigma B factor antagonist